MPGVVARTVIMVGMKACLPQVRIVRSIGRSPSVAGREPTATRTLKGYRTQVARSAVWVVRCHPKKLLLGRDEAFRCRVLSGLSQGVHDPQISGRLNTEASETVPPMGTVFQIARREAIGDAMIDTWIYAHLRWWSSRTSCDCPRAGERARNTSR